ncbi:peptide-methionine (S)-S-oxide reductase [Bradyrhizobium sp. ISRA463]|uniref:peptide-methionine (S)-S-oxide reductase n=1 Tax=unclassified Bradyrhizobium TaxID=2631580 RepID=UPI0032B083F0
MGSRPDVMSTRAGYSSGDRSNAAYRRTHAEVIEIIFNAYQTPYRDLLGFFFRIHDPTTLNRQENCAGS